VSDEVLVGLREIDRASTTPLQDAIDKLGADGDGLELSGGRDARGGARGQFEATKTWGAEREWSVAAAVAWAKDMGYAAMGKLKWSPK
jgi:hypothetical protein